MSHDGSKSRARFSSTKAELSGFYLCVAAVTFFLNDFLFIAVSGSSGVYYADYLSRLVVLTICLGFGATRSALLSEVRGGRIGWPLICVIILALVAISRLSHILIEPAIIGVFGKTSLFYFPLVENELLYAFDLSVGLMLVAVTEEIVFRKYMLIWLRGRGMTAVQIILLSSILFALMHWGSGVHRVAATFVFGVAAMVLYMRHTRLWPIILAHYLSNYIAFANLDQ